MRAGLAHWREQRTLSRGEREREREPQWGRVVVGGRGLAVHPNINIYQPTRRFSLLIQSNLHLTSSYLS